MKKYFYTDPLKAAWMTREFEIKIELNGNSFSDNFNFASISLETAKTFNIRYYIHTDFHEMFNPKENDLIISGGMIIQSKECLDYTNLPIVCPLVHIKGYNSFDESLKIIQRNGKAFFMPEVEE